ncbi:MAG: GNAT family N-acetyltransferase [Bacillota bacterium]
MTQGRTQGSRFAPSPGEVVIERIGPKRLPEYCSIPTLVDIRTTLEVREVDGGLGGIVLEERPVQTPWVKDYDSYSETPADWPKQWDLRNWCLLLATIEGRAVGGVCIVTRTKGVNMLEGRDDLAVLWDIRVSPAHKRRGIGRALFAEAVEWSREQGMTTLKIETQNDNVPACKFYSGQGAHLGAINRFAYRDALWSHPDVRNEVMLLWYYQL